MIALKDAATPKNLAWTKAPARVTVNSVTQVTRGAPGFSSVVEAWWPYRDAIGDIAGRDDIVFNIVLDEVVYQPHGKRAADPLPAGYLKTIGAYGLPPTVDGDAFWRYHTEIHGVDVMNAAGDLLMEYSLNRRVETLAGAPGFFAMIEMGGRTRPRATDTLHAPTRSPRRPASTRARTTPRAAQSRNSWSSSRKPTGRRRSRPPPDRAPGSAPAPSAPPPAPGTASAWGRRT